MKKTYIKTIIREIKQSFGRFMAIFAIVALGVGFLAGLLVSTPNMRDSINQYYQEKNMADIVIKGNLGLTRDDLEEVSKLKEIKDIMPAYVTDVLIDSEAIKEVLASKVYGLPFNDLKSESNNFINQLTLLKGRMPRAKNECVVEQSGIFLTNIELGTVLKISEENDDYDDINDIYDQKEFIVVGVVSNPFYFSKEREPSSVGNGRLSAILYVDESSYALEEYTDFYITLKDSFNYDSFIDEYEDYVEPITKKLRNIGKKRSVVRYQEVKDEADDKLQTVEDIYDSAKEDIEVKLDSILKKVEEGKANIAKAESQVYLPESVRMTLDSAREEVISAQINYNYIKNTSETELEKIDERIEEAKEKIDEIKEAKWYVLDRGANISHASFTMNVEKVAIIATVFPMFFFLVAALVALTTMTRMVDEQRTQIGTLKALGYTKGTIMSKYLIYSGFASIMGSILGLIVGFEVLPAVIWNAYKVMYHLPGLTTKINWGIAIPSSMAAIICTTSATFYVCYNTLKEKPAELMVPRAPKAGKRIFLENITFIWKRMKFSYKATARNLIRYKKHFFMTVIGVSGCTALLLAGLGLRDSVKSITDIQFGEILKYDLVVGLDDTKDYDDILEDFLGNKNKVESYAEIYSEIGYAKSDNGKYTTSIYVPREPKRFKKFINLREPKTGKPVTFNDTSVVMTQKLADFLELGIGDSFIIENADDESARFVITGIAENYVSSYVYINPKAYARAFGENIAHNTLIVTTTNQDEIYQDAILREVLGSDAVLSAEFASQTKDAFDNLLQSINFIVIVLIIAAAALAVTVLYNLTNINIAERKKELATLKVLGFHNTEVAAYIFREISILTGIGIMVGLFLGTMLHKFIILTTESTEFMMGRDITIMSFVISALLTIFFSVIVDVIMYGKLKNIEMVDSMKAID